MWGLDTVRPPHFVSTSLSPPPESCAIFGESVGLGDASSAPHQRHTPGTLTAQGPHTCRTPGPQSRYTRDTGTPHFLASCLALRVG
jgi:hypothetical protein